MSDRSGATAMRAGRSPWWSAASLVVAAGCGGDDEGARRSEGLGSSLEEIQEKAKEEGQVNLVNWAGYVAKD